MQGYVHSQPLGGPPYAAPSLWQADCSGDEVPVPEGVCAQGPCSEEHLAGWELHLQGEEVQGTAVKGECWKLTRLNYNNQVELVWKFEYSLFDTLAAHCCF